MRWRDLRTAATTANRPRSSADVEIRRPEKTRLVGLTASVLGGLLSLAGVIFGLIDRNANSTISWALVLVAGITGVRTCTQEAVTHGDELWVRNSFVRQVIPRSDIVVFLEDRHDRGGHPHRIMVVVRDRTRPLILHASERGIDRHPFHRPMADRLRGMAAFGGTSGRTAPPPTSSTATVMAAVAFALSD